MRWLLLALLVGALAGSASAAFLLALDWVTQTRERQPWLIAFLPLAGLLTGWVYWRLGKAVEAGNNLLIDEIHTPRAVVPLRMAPLVLAGTLVAHLFGASVGREGTAVQMGGSLADQLTHLFRLRAEDRRILLMAGMSAGFASVFGTPLAGAVFGLEVLFIGRMRYDAILPCFIAAIVGDQVTLAWGVQHSHYVLNALPAFSLMQLLPVLLAGCVFGLAGRLFALCTHGLAAGFKACIAWPPARPLLGGLLISLAVWLLDSQRYIGLGLPVMQQAFAQPLPWWDCLGKFLFTVLSLGSGFKGGEVTPLFYIGATLGNTLAPLLQLPYPLLAALGFVAVFAGAANIPLAATLMAMELFGPGMGPWAALACVCSYLCSGPQGIYRAQRWRQHKLAFGRETQSAETDRGH